MHSIKLSFNNGFFSLNFSNIIGATSRAKLANFVPRPFAKQVKHFVANEATFIFASFSII